MKEQTPRATSYLFSGDHILGSPSTFAEDLSSYMSSLYKLRDIKENNFDYLLVAHSVSIKEEDANTVIMDGPSKLAKYIRYREGRFRKLEQAAKKLCTRTPTVSRHELWEAINGHMNGFDRGSIMVLNHDLDEMIEYLINLNKIEEVS